MESVGFMSPAELNPNLKQTSIPSTHIPYNVHKLSSIGQWLHVPTNDHKKMSTGKVVEGKHYHLTRFSRTFVCRMYSSTVVAYLYTGMIITSSDRKKNRPSTKTSCRMMFNFWDRYYALSSVEYWEFNLDKYINTIGGRREAGWVSIRLFFQLPRPLSVRYWTYIYTAWVTTCASGIKSISWMTN